MRKIPGADQGASLVRYREVWKTVIHSQWSDVNPGSEFCTYSFYSPGQVTDPAAKRKNSVPVNRPVISTSRYLMPLTVSNPIDRWHLKEKHRSGTAREL